MNKGILLMLALVAVGGALFFSAPREHERQIGIIVPIEHEALTQIVNGFKDELSDTAITVKVMNAQGDQNIQRTIIEQLVRERSEILVPIGTAASQMTLNLAKEQNIVCLAADIALLPPDRTTRATLLSDELAAADSLALLHIMFPEIKKITLLYSSAEKIAKEIPLVIRAARAQGIDVQKLMIQNLSELYTMSQAIAPDSEAIFVLKDHLVVSGIQTVSQQAAKRGIPLMTSDEGSVIGGGAFAIGVKEASIGKVGAQIVKKILAGASPTSIPQQTMQGPFPLFVNKAACIKQGIDFERFLQRVETARVPIHLVDSEEE